MTSGSWACFWLELFYFFVLAFPQKKKFFWWICNFWNFSVYFAPNFEIFFARTSVHEKLSPKPSSAGCDSRIGFAYKSWSHFCTNVDPSRLSRSEIDRHARSREDLTKAWPLTKALTSKNVFHFPSTWHLDFEMIRERGAGVPRRKEIINISPSRAAKSEIKILFGFVFFSVEKTQKNMDSFRTHKKIRAWGRQNFTVRPRVTKIFLRALEGNVVPLKKESPVTAVDARSLKNSQAPVSLAFKIACARDCRPSSLEKKNLWHENKIRIISCYLIFTI